MNNQPLYYSPAIHMVMKLKKTLCIDQIPFFYSSQYLMLSICHLWLSGIKERDLTFLTIRRPSQCKIPWPDKFVRFLSSSHNGFFTELICTKSLHQRAFPRNEYNFPAMNITSPTTCLP